MADQRVLTQHPVVAIALATWREAERLLDELPPLSPDRESVALALSLSRDTYRSLTATSHATAEQLALAQRRLAAARRTLRRTQSRIGDAPGSPRSNDLVDQRR